MSEDKGTRLSVVVKDLNIGIDHIVEFLNKKGFAVEKKPTAKISAEAFDLLQKEFAQDKQQKQVAQEITKEKQRKENIVIEARPISSSSSSEKKVVQEDNLQESLFHIKQEAAEKEKQKKASAKETEPAPKTPVAEKTVATKKEPAAEPEVIKAKAGKIE